MAGRQHAESDEIILSVSKTRRDYHLSLGLLLAGVVAIAVYFGIVLTGHAPLAASPAASVAFSAVGNVGFTLTSIGAIFAAINWSLLRKTSQRS